MKSKYKVIVLITSLLVLLSISISIINYFVSLNNAQDQLKNQSLPLSLDNIYTDIQKNIIQPYLVSSMMANDTFVHDWLNHEEKNQDKIVKYLEAIKNKYNMFNTFLVSNKTQNYYTPQGFIEKVKEDNPANKWYFDFKNIQNHHEINLDFNEHMSNNMIMFINYKIFDSQFHYIGATGVAIQISYIDDLLETFRIKHKFQVTFFNKDGEVVLSERDIYKIKNLQDDEALYKYKDLILTKKSNLIEYTQKNTRYIINTKYIPELDLYLSVKANLDDFTKDVENIFYLNLLISIIITTVVAFIVYYIIKSYSKKLEYYSQYDTLTEVSNRREFETNLNRQIQLNKRKKQDIALVFLDIDNFKDINDNFGHAKGDLVLKEVAIVLQGVLRKTDFVARWGGEEFILALHDISLDDARAICEKLREELKNNSTLKNIINKSVTASFGLTMLKSDDDIESVISRSDEAMYLSKNNGKDQINIL